MGRVPDKSEKPYNFLRDYHELKALTSMELTQSQYKEQEIAAYIQHNPFKTTASLQKINKVNF
jgi:hypothetical protein